MPPAMQVHGRALHRRRRDDHGAADGHGAQRARPRDAGRGGGGGAGGGATAGGQGRPRAAVGGRPPGHHDEDGGGRLDGQVAHAARLRRRRPGRRDLLQSRKTSNNLPRRPRRDLRILVARSRHLLRATSRASHRAPPCRVFPWCKQGAPPFVANILATVIAKTLPKAGCLTHAAPRPAPRAHRPPAARLRSHLPPRPPPGHRVRALLDRLPLPAQPALRRGEAGRTARGAARARVRERADAALRGRDGGAARWRRRRGGRRRRRRRSGRAAPPAARLGRGHSRRTLRAAPVVRSGNGALTFGVLPKTTERIPKKSHRQRAHGPLYEPRGGPVSQAFWAAVTGGAGCGEA